MPTASGKSAIAKTLMNAHRSVSVLTPTNLLVKQFQAEFQDTPSLARLDSYYCEEWQRPCPTTRTKLMKFCKGCKCGRDLAVAKFQRGPGVYNYYTYLAHKLYRDVVVIDEAHNLIPVIKDRLAIRLWQHDYKYPHNMNRPEQIREWIGTLSDTKRKGKKIQLLREAATYKVPDYVYEFTEEWFNGKGTVRGEPELRPLIKLLPVDISNAPPMFWSNKEVKKTVLMSGTISRKDIEQLGLSRKRVLYIECKSPIPPESRPIYFEPTVSVNRQNMDLAPAELAEYITYVANQFPTQKGVVHVTYTVSSLLRNYLSHSPRYIFHTRDNKSDMYTEFRNSNPESGRILVACGMYEGLDLPDDSGRWQIIAKVPWPSLQNPAIKHMADRDPEWYAWECIKIIVQASGRICRTPTDFGQTFIPDKSFYRLLNEFSYLFPTYFREALILYE